MLMLTECVMMDLMQIQLLVFGAFCGTTSHSLCSGAHEAVASLGGTNSAI